MKAFVDITGQVKGNLILKNKIQSQAKECEVREMNFNSFRILFETVGEAKKAIKGAYNSLRADEPSIKKGEAGGINLVNGECLMYDASKAVMFRNNTSSKYLRIVNCG